MAQIEEENIANKPKLDFFHIWHKKNFKGLREKKWGKMWKIREIPFHVKKFGEITKFASLGLF